MIHTAHYIALTHSSPIPGVLLIPAQHLMAHTGITPIWSLSVKSKTKYLTNYVDIDWPAAH